MSEVCGASGDISASMDEFNGCLTETGLITLPMQGNTFTWHNCSTDSRSLWRRLDRMLGNDRWLELCPGTHYVSLNPRTSDHSPLVLKGELQNPSVMLFWFDNYLASSPNFIPVVHSIWRNQVVGTSMNSVMRKLKSLKPLFRQQLKKKGDLSQNVDQAKDFLDVAQNLLNTNKHNTPWASRILPHEDSVRLTNPVSVERIKLAFFDIAEDKSPRPDGYTAAFYKAVWPIVGDEITLTIMDFFTNGWLLKQVNATLLVLIPRVQSPSSVSDFRPISCCNVLYKAIMKILVQRLLEILDDLISTSQNAFIPKRKIGDNILLAQ
ncbi:UNVERIFIED_CONTAM: hypothetical protein Sangu_2980800 [Sesamum angustifolium]|uniref:Reverse transcriptase domain-containing protein n=1 Tax=Sesamum angustifolium TaxID=2727405 RepID=A0AAW2IIN2_9LAMI